jgi:hypothetical protein
MPLPIEVKFQSMGRHMVLYYFQNTGDELPTHSHTISHDGIAAAGRFQVTGEVNGQQVSHEIDHPHKINIPSMIPHSFKALTPNSILLNVFEGKYQCQDLLPAAYPPQPTLAII